MFIDVKKHECQKQEKTQTCHASLMPTFIVIFDKKWFLNINWNWMKENERDVIRWDEGGFGISCFY